MKIAIAIQDNTRITAAELERFLHSVRAADGTTEGYGGATITVERDEETAHTGLIYEHKEPKR